MAYNKKNYYKRLRYIIDIYNQHKYEDVPDTRIIKNIFPKYGINLSYRQWMNIKSTPVPKETT
ncbi:hypothetical protein BWK63_05030 [Flavobacterium covae]|nr:hypothetical protein BWK63_05030 [Flavobacterium covae]